MTEPQTPTVEKASELRGPPPYLRLADLIVRKCSADDDTRRGLCLLSAGRFDEAIIAFESARSAGVDDDQLCTLLGAASAGNSDHAAAAAHFAAANSTRDALSINAIRAAHAFLAADRASEAITTLRLAIKKNPTSAELHFQLGTFLASQEETDEASLRFTQALSIDRHHIEAHVSLALTCGLQRDPRQAVNLLRHAQSLRPDDARIGLLLTYAMREAAHQGHTLSVRPAITGGSRCLPDRWIDQLAAIVESEPDFVDAFLSLSPDCVDALAYENLLRTLQRALEHMPEHAELHYHCGRVLDRLHRTAEAIEQTERACGLDPMCVRALIALGILYQTTNRKADATSRLEQAVRAGADYADVHFSLGNLYRDQGLIVKARSAYRSALALNERYEPARQALTALPK